MGSPRKKKFTVVAKLLENRSYVTRENELSAAGAAAASVERLAKKLKINAGFFTVVAVFRGHHGNQFGVGE